MAQSPTPRGVGKAAGRSRSRTDLERRRAQRIVDIEGEVLTRLLTARMKVRIDGRSQTVTVLQVIMTQVWSRTLRGDERPKARQILLGFVSLIPKSQRAAIGVILLENDYTASVAAQVRGVGDAE